MRRVGGDPARRFCFPPTGAGAGGGPRRAGVETKKEEAKMKQRHSARDFLAGALTMALAVGLLTTAGAALTGKTIEVLTGAEIYIDGVKLEPTDANGNPVETFVYNGTTYVPLRAVSQSLGKAVNWDGENQRVYIGEAPGVKQYLLKVCQPYEVSDFYTQATYTMAGEKYANGFVLGRLGPKYAWAMFNLNGQYDKLSFDVGHIDGEAMEKTQYNIYLDDELAFSVDLSPEDMPQHYEVQLNGALKMKIETVDWGHVYAMTNVEIY